MKNLTQSFYLYRAFGVPFVLGALLVACSNNEPADPLPSQTVSQILPQLEPPPPLPPPEIREVPSTKSTGVKVISDGKEGGDQPKSLAEASLRAKQKKGQRKPSVLEINDDNLHEYAQGGDVIVLESEPAAAAPELPQPGAADPDTAANRADDGIRDEEYWRNRALEIRMGWRRTVDRIKELELESAALRQQFYAEDDPYIRDGQLKPAWDRVLDRLSQLKQRSDQYEEELEAFIADGRRAEALQGWLNQGWELEPTAAEMPWSTTPAKTRKLPGHQAVDVPTIEEDYDP